MNKNYTCSICGKTLNDLDTYLSHVAKCGAQTKKDMEAEKNKKYLEEVNAAINKVKAAKDYYKECLNDFKKKYPKEYALNFGKSECNCELNNTNTKTDKTNKKATNNKNDKNVSFELSGKDAYEFLQLLNTIWNDI